MSVWDEVEHGLKEEYLEEQGKIPKAPSELTKLARETIKIEISNRVLRFFGLEPIKLPVGFDTVGREWSYHQPTREFWLRAGIDHWIPEDPTNFWSGPSRKKVW